MKRIAMIAAWPAGRASRVRRRLRRDRRSQPHHQQHRAEQKIYVQDGSGRFVDAGGRATLIKGDTLYIIDDADKSYVVFDKATMQQLANKLNAEMAKLKEQLAKLPPEQRAQMEQMMGGALAGEGQQWTVDVVGYRQVGQGRRTRLQALGRDTQWRARRADLRGAVFGTARQGEFPDRVRELRQVFEEMAKSVPMLAGMMANEFSAQVKANGFPVRRAAYESGKLGDEETLVKVWREEAIPASMFEIPAGYKQKQMPMGPGQ